MWSKENIKKKSKFNNEALILTLYTRNDKEIKLCRKASVTAPTNDLLTLNVLDFFHLARFIFVESRKHMWSTGLVLTDIFLHKEIQQ